MARSSRYLTSLSSVPMLNRYPRCHRLRQHQSRPFSSTPTTQAMPKPHNSTKVANKLQNRKSRMVEMMNLPASKIPEDLGLLPQTFIRPPNRHMPKLFGSAWKARLRSELLWVRTRLQNFSGYMAFDSIGISTPRPPANTPDHPVWSTFYGGLNANSPNPKEPPLTSNPAPPSLSTSTRNSTPTSPPANCSPSTTSSAPAWPKKHVPS